MLLLHSRELLDNSKNFQEEIRERMWKNIIYIVRDHDIYMTNFHPKEREKKDLFHNLREREKERNCNICGK